MKVFLPEVYRGCKAVGPRALVVVAFSCYLRLPC